MRPGLLDLLDLSTAALRRAGLSLVVTLSVVAGWCGSALAQESDLRALADQVERLQREVSDLQRTVYSGAPPAPGSVAPVEGTAAQHLLRLEQLEAELRQLTGQIEELTYRQTQLEQKVDRINADTDLRLRQLEGTAPPAGTTTGAADTGGAMVVGGVAPSASSTDAGTPTESSAVGATTGPAAPATGSRTLGTISEADLAAQRGQGPDRTAAATAAAAAAAGQTASTASPAEAEYQQAFGLLRQQNYAGAEEALRAFVSQHPDDPLAGNAQYWLGETYYVRKDYRQAAVTFAEGYQRYPKSAKAPDNLLKLGLSLAQIGEKNDACAAFAQLAKQFPDAPASLKDRASRERQRIGCG